MRQTDRQTDDLARRRADRLASLGELLAGGASVAAPLIEMTDEETSGIADPAPPGAPSMPDASIEEVPRAAPGGPAAAPTSGDFWQRRQVELLSRIDENLRRLRELQESPRDAVAVFTEPAV